MRLLCLFFCGLILHSCWIKKEPIPRSDTYYKKVFGWKAVYGADTTYKKLTYHPAPKPMENPGKIYVIGNTIFQNDVSKGIHIIDNRDYSNPRRVSFIELPGNTEMAVKGHYMYANNFNDLVVIDIGNSAAPVFVKRLPDMFNSYNANKPYVWQAPPESGYFECPRFNNDSVIVRWVRDTVYSTCYRP